MKHQGFAFGSLRKFQEKNDEKVGFGGLIMGTQYHQNVIKANGFSLILIFTNVWFFDYIFNVYEFQEKQNIEYYWGLSAKSQDFHDDWRGSQGENIEY